MLQLVRDPSGDGYEVRLGGRPVGSVRSAAGHVRAECDGLTVYAEEALWPLADHLPEACAAILAALHDAGRVRLYEIVENHAHRAE